MSQKSHSSAKATNKSTEFVPKVNAALKTSPRLIRNLQSRDVDSWNRMVELYAPLVYYWCHRSGLAKQDIPDVFQEVFYSVANNIDQFKRDKKGTFRGWLRTITNHKTFDHFRKSARVPTPAGGTEAQHFIEQIPMDISSTDKSDNHPNSHSEDIAIERDFLKRALANIRGHFNDNTWQAFWHVVIDGRTTNDVANQLAMMPGAVRVAKSRVLKRLRQECGDSMD